MILHNSFEHCQGTRCVFGTCGKDGRFGGAYPQPGGKGYASLQYWETAEDGSPLLQRKLVKCRSYRRAVRVLRWHLMGYKV